MGVIVTVLFTLSAYNPNWPPSSYTVPVHEVCVCALPDGGITTTQGLLFLTLTKLDLTIESLPQVPPEATNFTVYVPKVV